MDELLQANKGKIDADVAQTMLADHWTATREKPPRMSARCAAMCRLRHEAFPSGVGAYTPAVP